MMKRTHTCGILRKTDAGSNATLNGWVQSSRDHGGIVFIDLRDRYGLTQVVFDPKHKSSFIETAQALRREDVIAIQGKVRERGQGLENPNLKTGAIEVLVDEIEVINKALTPPIEIDDRMDASEELRLKYRYLDLRRPKMQQRLMFRHKMIASIREFLNAKEFIEIETPMLIKTTPEGARDYLVPSRVHPGKFYSLPQSPQIYKQILMIAGYDKYFQIARCLRDEDLRQDRQPEHTQLDLEMSFADIDDVFHLTQELIKHVFKQNLGKDVKTPFLRIKYDESMEKYCTDKPDLRFGMHSATVTDIVKDSDFKVFKEAIGNNLIVKALNAQGCAEKLSRNQIDDLIAFAQQQGAKGLAWMKVTANGLESNIAKFFSADIQKILIEKIGAKPGDLLLFAADKEKLANDVLSRIRTKLAKDLGLIKEAEYAFCFVTDFPMFEWNDEENKWDFGHNPFTMPKKEDLKYLELDPSKVSSYQYDFVINGTEMFSGSVRNTIPELQQKMFEITGMSKETIESRFGFLLEAYQYGAPVHAGFGLGIDRLAALLQGLTDIREVIAFPKNKAAQSLMDGSPSDVPDKQLKELHLKTDIVKKQ